MKKDGGGARPKKGENKDVFERSARD